MPELLGTVGDQLRFDFQHILNGVPLKRMPFRSLILSARRRAQRCSTSCHGAPFSYVLCVRQCGIGTVSNNSAFTSARGAMKLNRTHVEKNVLAWRHPHKRCVKRVSSIPYFRCLRLCYWFFWWRVSKGWVKKVVLLSTPSINH